MLKNLKDRIKRFFHKTHVTGPEPRGCGISWLWMLRDDHPFKAVCDFHDDIHGKIDEDDKFTVEEVKMLEEADLATFEAWKLIAKIRSSRLNKFQAYLFYPIIRAWAKWKRKKSAK